MTLMADTFPEEGFEVSFLRHVSEQTALLEHLRRIEEYSIAELAASDGPRRIRVLENFPVAGGRRFIVNRLGQGSQVTLAANTPVQLLQANEARLGGTIVNNGVTNPVLLFLGRVEEVNVTAATQIVPMPVIGLTQNGGSWDFRLGNLLWCGRVAAMSVAGTTLTWAEV